MLHTLLARTNTTRVLDDLRTLRSFGSRPPLSDADMDVRRWLAARFEDAGLLGVQLDGLGSVYGSSGIDHAPALLMGAHTDTTGPASWLDGSLGLAYALEAARVLLEHKADTELCDQKGQSPLIISAYFGRLEVVRLLLQHGANVHHRSNFGTALADAEENGHEEVAALLRAHGAT